MKNREYYLIICFLYFDYQVFSVRDSKPYPLPTDVKAFAYFLLFISSMFSTQQS